MANSQIPPWFRILLAARSLQSAGASSFTAKDLVVAAELTGTERTTDVQLASAWLGKFRKWGYIQIVGKTPGSKFKPINEYSLTDVGHTADLTPGPISQLSQILATLEAYEALRKTKKADQAWADVVQVAKEIKAAKDKQKLTE